MTDQRWYKGAMPDPMAALTLIGGFVLDPGAIDRAVLAALDGVKPE